MSGVWGWFGGSSASQKRKDSPKNAILELRSQVDMLQKRARHLETQAEEQDALVRKYLAAKNRAAAKDALKRKKNHEDTLQQTRDQLESLERQVNAIESANINRETLAAMEKATKAMKSIHSNLTPEKVDETMASLQEQNALSQEIVQAITSAQVGDPVDEEDLLDELDALEQEQLDNQMLKSGTVPSGPEKLPSVPNTEVRASSSKTPVAVGDSDDDEIAKLQAEMAM